MNSLERLAELASASPEATDSQIARAFIEEQRTRAALAEAVLPFVIGAAANARRNQVRTVERRVFRRRTGDAVDSVNLRKELLGETFALGDGRFVSWGQATVEDHEARIALLQRLVDGLNGTIQRHVDSIAEITAAGVTCLDDIADAA